jgi:hypothetical protein
MLFRAGLPAWLWPDAILAAVYITNRLPTKGLADPMTPYQVLNDVKPNVGHIKAWGCLVMVSTPHPAHKLARRSERCILVGYEHNAWRCISLDNNWREVTSANCIFHEKQFPGLAKFPAATMADLEIDEEHKSFSSPPSLPPPAAAEQGDERQAEAEGQHPHNNSPEISHPPSSNNPEEMGEKQVSHSQPNHLNEDQDMGESSEDESPHHPPHHPTSSREEDAKEPDVRRRKPRSTSKNPKPDLSTRVLSREKGRKGKGQSERDEEVAPQLQEGKNDLWVYDNPQAHHLPPTHMSDENHEFLTNLYARMDTPWPKHPKPNKADEPDGGETGSEQT